MATIDDLGSGPILDGRRDPVAILREQDEWRLSDLVPVRHERMAATPFTFFRGAAAVMAADLASTPSSGVLTQLCGDAHLSNFGLFLSPQRRMVFDLNDFDETHPGPFEWDVKRLAASMAVAAKGNGATDKEARRAARKAARSYRHTMRESAKKGALACWYDHVDVDQAMDVLGDQLDTTASQRTRKLINKAHHRDSAQALEKLCTTDANGSVHIRSDPPLLIPAAEIFTKQDPAVLNQAFMDRFDAYRESLPSYIETLTHEYELVEVARKVVGVGSVGTRCWIALFKGKENGDPLFMQMKEASESVLAPYVDVPQFTNQGNRVVFGQQLLQASSDILLGWFSAVRFTSQADSTAGYALGNSDFYVRQLRDGKGSVVIEGMPIDRLTWYGKLCGAVLAQGHARTSARAEIGACLEDWGKKFDREIADWSLRYCEINDADHARMVEAIDSGEITAASLEE